MSTSARNCCCSSPRTSSIMAHPFTHGFRTDPPSPTRYPPIHRRGGDLVRLRAELASCCQTLPVVASDLLVLPVVVPLDYVFGDVSLPSRTLSLPRVPPRRALSGRWG